jgi:hypothetical protein
MSEYNIKFQIKPENYDYSEEEIVYRIFINDQLIIERSLPRLTQNQELFDFFCLKLDNLKSNIILFENIKNKIAKPSKIFIEDISFNLPKSGKNIVFKFKKLAFRFFEFHK